MPEDQHQPQPQLQAEPQPAPAPDPTGQFEPVPVQKPSKWRYFFIALGLLQALGVALFVTVLVGAIQLANAGASGTEFIGWILLSTVVPAVTILALINLVGLPIFMVRHKPHGKGLVLSILSLLISLALAGYGGFLVYEVKVEGPKQAKQLEQQSQRQIQAQQQQFAADNSKPEITEDQAISLLKACQLKGFYYTNQTTKDDGNWGELSSTGVVLTKIDGQPYRISIADRLVPALVPIARAAQKTCGGQPQFWHDGSYEQ